MDVRLPLNPTHGEASNSEKRNRPRAFPSDDSSKNSVTSNAEKPRQRRSGDILCELCTKADFDAMFGNRYLRISRLPTLKERIKNSHCRMCSLIKSCVCDSIREDQIHPIEARSVNRTIREWLNKGVPFESIRCDIQYGMSDAYLYTRRKDVASVEGARVRLSAEPAYEYKIYLDVVETDPIARNSISSKPFMMVRKPLTGEPFDPGFLRRWLDESDPLPLRRGTREFIALALKPLIDEGRFRVIDTMTGDVMLLPQSARYIALSYVWGNQHHRTSDKLHASLDMDHKNSIHIDIDTLPQTIRDACSLVRAINEQYLWVDALCIDQSDASDKHANTSQMGAIYENAYFTIIAANGENADYGLARLRTGTRIERAVAVLENKSWAFLPPRKTLDQVLVKTRWGNRAWTFQERALSRRYVVFAEDEVFFQCPDFESREAYELVENSNYPQPANGLRGGGRKRRRPSWHTRLSTQTLLDWEYYWDAVEEYSGRELTYPGDRLDAFMGISERFHNSDTTMAQKLALSGMAPENFDVQLSWDFDFLVPSRGKPGRIRMDTRKSRYLPSWSWVGWEGAISTSQSVRSPPSFPVRVIDASNIVCTMHYSSWRESPTFIEVKQPLRVVLHLWASTVSCHLKAVQSDNGEEDWILYLAGRAHDLDRVELGRLSNICLNKCLAEIHTNLDHYLVSLGGYIFGYYRQPLLLVEGRNNTMERLGILRLTNESRDACEEEDRAHHFVRERYLQLI